MAVAQLAFNMIVFGTNPGDYFYTQPAVMALTNGIHAAINCISFSGTGSIDVWVQTSDDIENWGYLGGGGGSPPSTPLFTFSGVGAQQKAVAASSGVSTYELPVGAAWVRFVFRVNGGSSAVNGSFSVRVNSFAG